MSNMHIQDWIQKDTPGAGNYSTKKLDEGIQWSVSKNPRFKLPSKATSKAPHSFEVKSTLSKFGCGIARDYRFKYERDDLRRSVKAPGPGNYEVVQLFKRHQEKINGMGRIKRFEEKSVDKNICKSFLSMGTPGPGQYEYKNNFKSGTTLMGKINPPQKKIKFIGGVD